MSDDYYEETPEELKSLFEWLGLKNEPRTGDQIEGILNEMIVGEPSERDIIWAMKLIDKRINESRDNED